MNADWFNVRDERLKEWSDFCPAGQFRLTMPDRLPGPLPTSLTKKYDSVLVTAAQDDACTTYFVLNGHRIDEKDRAVDQQPFGLAFENVVPAPSGCLIQHGDWPGRTTYPPQQFWNGLKEHGQGLCQPFTELPKKSSGRLDSLTVPSQLAAQRLVIGELKAFRIRFHDDNHRHL
jgi:hypothetical protein